MSQENDGLYIGGQVLPPDALKTLRLALTPSADEVANRSVRDTTRSGLLQHEMAKRIGCSTSTIRDCERDKRIPQGKAVQSNFISLWKQVMSN